MYSQAAHWDSPLAMAQMLNLPVKAYMRCNLSALLGVGTRASCEIWSVIPMAGAAEMTGVSPADMKGVRNAETTADTRGTEARLTLVISWSHVVFLLLLFFRAFAEL